MRLLLPKMAREQPRWAQALTPLPVALTWIDPWRISLLQENAEMRTNWLNLDTFAGVICVSPTAAERLVAAVNDYWPQLPINIRWLCNGPRSAAVLQQAAIPAAFPVTGYTSEHLLRLPQSKVQPGDKWLIVKGEKGRTVMKDTLQRRGAIVTEQMVYSRRLERAAVQQCVSHAKDCDVLWLSSSELGEALWATAGDFWQHWRGQWWVSSRRLHDWCLARGITRCARAANASVEALVTMIQQQALIKL